MHCLCSAENIAKIGHSSFLNHHRSCGITNLQLIFLTIHVYCAQIRDEKSDRAAIDCGDQVPAETRTWMNDILFAVGVSCFLFLAVDNADTCAGRFCAVEIQKVSII